MSKWDGRNAGSTVILVCRCNNDFQDKRYGRGHRVHNIGGGTKTSGKKATCTVCGSVKL